MKERKTEFRFFTVPEWQKEEAYLREQHKKGWKFVKVNGLGMYHFQKSTPEDVVYQLDYNPDSRDHREEYVQLFRDCGWEYLQNYVGYSYFRKPASGLDGTEEEIFCDDSSRLDMMKRVFQGRMIPLLIIFCLLLIQIVLQGVMNTPLSSAFMILLSVLAGLYIGVFISFARSYWKYTRSVH